MKETKKTATAKVAAKPAVAKKAAPKATKPAAKPAKAPAKKVAKAPAKAPVKAPAKKVAKAPAKKVVKAEVKPAAKTAAKPAAKAPAKKVAKAPAKKVVKAEVKPAAATAAKPAQKKTVVGRAEEEKKALKIRINRVIGQLNGIAAMVDEGRSSEDILIQLVSSYKSVKSISNLLVETHLRAAIKENANNPKAVDNAMEILKRYQ